MISSDALSRARAIVNEHDDVLSDYPSVRHALIEAIAQALGTSGSHAEGVPSEPPGAAEAAGASNALALKITQDWLNSLDDFTQSCIADRINPLFDAVAAALRLASGGSPGGAADAIDAQG